MRALYYSERMATQSHHNTHNRRAPLRQGSSLRGRAPFTDHSHNHCATLPHISHGTRSGGHSAGHGLSAGLLFSAALGPLQGRMLLSVSKRRERRGNLFFSYNSPFRCCCRVTRTLGKHKLCAYLLLLWALRHVCEEQTWHLTISKGASTEAQPIILNRQSTTDCAHSTGLLTTCCDEVVKIL